jgi:PAS domain S-box-containing protein
MPARHHADHPASMARVQAGGERHIIGRTVEAQGRRKDGSEFPLQLSLSEWSVAGANFFTAIIHDLTERKNSSRIWRTNATCCWR